MTALLYHRPHTLTRSLPKAERPTLYQLIRGVKRWFSTLYENHSFFFYSSPSSCPRCLPRASKSFQALTSCASIMPSRWCSPPSRQTASPVSLTKSMPSLPVIRQPRQTPYIPRSRPTSARLASPWPSMFRPPGTTTYGLISKRKLYFVQLVSDLRLKRESIFNYYYPAPWECHWVFHSDNTKTLRTRGSSRDAFQYVSSASGLGRWRAFEANN